MWLSNATLLAVTVLFIVGIFMVRQPPEPLSPIFMADRVVVEKAARRLSLLRHSTILMSCHVSVC